MALDMKTVFNTAQIQQITTLVANTISSTLLAMTTWYTNVNAWVSQVLFNKTNTNAIINANTAALDTSTGVITYSGHITKDLPASFALTNALLTPTSVVQWGVIYSTGAKGKPTPQFYTITGSVSPYDINFSVFNTDLVYDTNANLSIYYTILAV